ncbi:MAG: hypothetical protein JSV19_05195 [Phycisphaerales bacterium]|nr:MAG: hypothetical protein JSV19_05195 [Phycisphaerales bacterium]
MSTFPRTFQIVRNGILETAQVHDAQELLQLRVELELIWRCGLGADERVRGVLNWLRARRKDSDIEDLSSVLNDAAHPVIGASIAQLDCESPEMREQLPCAVIREASERFHQDVAHHIRNSGLRNAEELAARYEKHVRVLARSRLVDTVGASPVQRMHVDPNKNESTPEQENFIMTEQSNDNNPADFDALAGQIDGAVGASAKAATEDAEAILHAVQEADEADVADSNAQADRVFDEAVTDPEPMQDEPEGPRSAFASPTAGAEPAVHNGQADADLRSPGELQGVVQEADQAEIADSNTDIEGFIRDALADAEEIAATDDTETTGSDATPTPPPQEDSAEGASDAAIDQPETIGSVDTSQAVESVLADVQASVERLADALATDSQPAAVRPTITLPVGMPTASPPVDEIEATEAIMANVEAGVASLTGEIGGDAEAQQASEAPADAAMPPDSGTAVDALNPASPPTGVDEIETGIRHFAQLLTGEVEQLWVGARQALSDAHLFRDELKQICDDARRMFVDIQATRAEMVEIREQARIDRQEARNLRDDMQKTLERIRALASEAANASDQAQSEARAAATHADRAREGKPPDP